MPYSKLYEGLIANIGKLVMEKSDKELYELGKQLSFRERILFDYKIQSMKEDFEFMENFAEYCNIKKLIKSLIDNDELSYILKNFDDICDYDFKTREPILEYLKKNADRIVNEELKRIKHSIIYNMLEVRYNIKIGEFNEIANLFEETAKNEGLTLFDIKKIDYGSYSTIYRIGSKIIKIGYRRRIDEIVDNNRILLPDTLLKIHSNIIEITDFIDGKSNFSTEEIYEVYKELRDQGVVWLDPTKDNLKRIDEENLKKQEKKSNNRDKYPFIKNRKFRNRQLRTNDLVIIDLDHMVDENDSVSIYEATEYLRGEILYTRESFEKRYLLENKKTIN